MPRAELAERRIYTDALEFAALEAGSGPLALCLHGFPDTPYTFRHLLPLLADAGFHAVAPFMRGYAPSGVPDDGLYRQDALVADAIALHDALRGDEQAVLIGHDWGADVAYAAGAAAPERWRRLVTLGIPPPPLDAMLFSDYDQLKRFFYVFLFQLPAAEELVSANDMAFVERLWRDWSPDYDPSDDLVWVKQSLGKRANLSAALGYYRALFAGDVPSGKQPPQPTLYLHGEEDGCIGVELVRDAGRHLADGSRAEIVPGTGHFLHLERPDEVGRLIVDWVSG